jgi:hypothetical protein
MTAATPGFPDEITSHDLHWLAGLLEGEGSFLKGPPSAPGLPVISLQMTDEDVVARVARMFGRTPSSWQAPHDRWQRTFITRATGAKAVAWMHALHPLMGNRRRQQIDEAMASYAPRSAALLDDDTARRALSLLACGASVRDVAAEFGTSVWCIYDLRGGRTYKHLQRE